MRFERYFFNESRDPVQREWSRTNSSAAPKWRGNSSASTLIWSFWPTFLPNLHISKPLLEELNIFQGWTSRRLIPAICVKPSGRVLSGWSVCVSQPVSASFRFMASHDGLDGLLVLPK
jgi:hypothetical protein